MIILFLHLSINALICKTVTDIFKIFTKPHNCFLVKKAASFLYFTKLSTVKTAPLASSVKRHMYVNINSDLGNIFQYRVSQEECARLREGVPYGKVYPI
jgi:hypothetical protein